LVQVIKLYLRENKSNKEQHPKIFDLLICISEKKNILQINTKILKILIDPDIEKKQKQAARKKMLKKAKEERQKAETETG
jgi:hypothetical protein